MVEEGFPLECSAKEQLRVMARRTDGSGNAIFLLCAPVGKAFYCMVGEPIEDAG